MFWDLGYGFDLKISKITGVLALVGSFVFTVLFYLIGKNINFFKKQIERKLSFSISKTLERAIDQIIKDYKFYNKKKCFILLSPAAASFDQFKNFEIRGNKFKKLCKKYARKFI